MSWAGKRQFIYFSGFLLFVASVLFLILYPVIFKKPVCNDGKQNGTERGIDCGGSCTLICRADSIEPVILWQRAFPITDGFYNLAAQIENRNADGGARSATYSFKAYDKDNNLIGEREGITYIPSGVPFLIFEPQFYTGDAIVSRVLFDFTKPIVWEKKKDTISILPIKSSNILFNNENNSPSLSARIYNDSIYDVPSFDIVALLYDKDHNVVNVSKTHKEKLKSSSETNVNFTWPKPFSVLPVTYNVELQINPFEVSF